MSNSEISHEPRSRAIALLLAAALFPVTVFIVFAGCTALNYPWLDDYEAALAFGNHLVALHGFQARFLWLLAGQINEYKTFFGHGLVWLELALLGHLNFTLLSLAGDIFIPILGLILWRLFIPEVPVERRLALFLPVSLVLFQYGYWETINWPLPGLQNLTILPLAFGSFCLLGRGTRAAFAGGVLLMLLGIAASGNGFIIAAVGLLMLLLRKQAGRLAVWSLALVVAVAAYSYHYNSLGTQDPRHEPLLLVLTHPHLVYIFGFMGASAKIFARPILLPGAVFLGAALCAFYAWAFRRGFLRQEPVVGYCLLFLFLTTLGVSGLRSGFGLEQSTSSRYRLYSDLFLVFAWFACVRLGKLATVPRLSQQRTYITVLSLSILFFLAANYSGMRLLLLAKADVRHGFADFEQSDTRLSPVYVPPGQVLRSPEFPEQMRRILVESERLGVYRPR